MEAVRVELRMIDKLSFLMKIRNFYDVILFDESNIELKKSVSKFCFEFQTRGRSSGVPVWFPSIDMK